MYAIIEVSGKQYKVEKNMKLYVDKLDEKNKAKLSIDKVLFFNDGKSIKVGMPYLKDITVSAEVEDQEFKDKKVIVFKYKNKTGYHKKQGHRQKYTVLNIKDIVTAKTKVSPNEETINNKDAQFDNKDKDSINQKETTTSKKTQVKE
jgi:large subunit ribosomal protein L21